MNAALLLLLIGGGVYALTRTSKSSKASGSSSSINLPDVAPDPEPLSPQSVEKVVREGAVETSKWGPIAYRIVTRDSGFSAKYRPYGEVSYVDLKTFDEIVRVFSSIEDAESYAVARIAQLDFADLPNIEDLPGPLVPDGEGDAPPTGPSGAGTCVANIYSRAPQRAAEPLMQAIIPAAQGVLEGRWMYMYPAVQDKVFWMIVEELLGANRSVRHVVVRRVLAKLAPSCNWSVPPQDLGKPEYLAWVASVMLAQAAEVQVGLRYGGDIPKGKLLEVDGAGYLVSRAWLDLPDVGSVQLPIGRRVELLVAEKDVSDGVRPAMVFAEEVFARVIGTDTVTGDPVVRLLAQFQGEDVSPAFSAQHGFRVGDDIQLRASDPTGIRRVFAEGVS